MRSSGLIRSPFVLLWASETAFDLGAAMMAFALGVWIFQRTGSAEKFTGAVLAAALPSLVVAPIAGVLADRVDRRWVIATCDAVSVLLIGVLAVLVAQGGLEARQLYVFNAAMAAVGVLRAPAYRAVFSAIVPVERLTQANGLVGLTQSLLQSGAPLVAGFVMGSSAGLGGVIAFEVVLMTGGALAVFGALSRARHAIRVPRDGDEGAVAGGSITASVVGSLASAVRYVCATRGLLGLAIYGVVHEALLILATSLLTPLVLSTHTSDDLGVILSCGALGALAGSLVLIARPVTRHLMIWVLVGDACLSLFVMVAGVVASTLGWSLCAFCALFLGAASGACASALWMARTTPARRGGVFAVLGALNLAASCAALWIGGRLGDHVLEPALADGGAWSASIGAWLGPGPGRGLRLVFIACGATSGAIALLGLLRGRLRRLDLQT